MPKVCISEIAFTWPAVHSAALRRNGPEHVGQIFEAKFGGFVEAQKFSFNLHAIAFAFDFGFASGPLHEFGAAEIDLGGAAGAAIVHGFGGAGDGGGCGSRRSCPGLRSNSRRLQFRRGGRLAECGRGKSAEHASDCEI